MPLKRSFYYSKWAPTCILVKLWTSKINKSKNIRNLLSLHAEKIKKTWVTQRKTFRFSLDTLSATIFNTRIQWRNTVTRLKGKNCWDTRTLFLTKCWALGPNSVCKTVKGWINKWALNKWAMIKWISLVMVYGFGSKLDIYKRQT